MAAGVAQADRELVADEFAATAGKDRWTACQTCPLLLAAVGREPSDEAVVWEYAAADCSAVASGGIAGLWEPENRSRPRARPRKKICAGNPERIYSVRLLAAKTEILDHTSLNASFRLA